MTILTLIAGAVAQLVDGVLGMGYGVSAATLLVAFGMAPAIVSATVHAAKLPTSVISGVAHYREGNLDRRIVLPLAAGGALGGVAGSAALTVALAGNVKPLVALLLMGLGVRMICTAVRGRCEKQLGRRLSAPQLVALGIVGGGLDAFGGGGWGPTCMSVLMTTDGREPRKLIGSVNAAEFVAAVSIVSTFVILMGVGSLAIPSVVPLVIGGVMTAPFAARICARVNARVLAAGVGVGLVALNASTLSGALGMGWLQPAFWGIGALAAVAVASVFVWQLSASGKVA